MRKLIVSLLAIVFAAPVFAQGGSVETDIFGDLVYRSRGDGYRAEFKKDIFDNLTFSDSRGNEIVFEKKYLDREFPGAAANGDAKAALFLDMVRVHRADEGYRATYSVDIFGTVKMEDNRGNRSEIGEDIFGNTTYEGSQGGRKESLERGLDGSLEFRSGNRTASLGKDIFGKWIYKDSDGNRFEFSDRTWARLVERFGGDEQVMFFLIGEFLD